MDTGDIVGGFLAAGMIFFALFLLGFGVGEIETTEYWHKELISRDLGHINSELKFEFNDKKENK